MVLLSAVNERIDDGSWQTKRHGVIMSVGTVVRPVESRGVYDTIYESTVW